MVAEKEPINMSCLSQSHSKASAFGDYCSEQIRRHGWRRGRDLGGGVGDKHSTMAAEGGWNGRGDGRSSVMQIR